MREGNRKVSIIRERSLNPWEMQNYLDLPGIELVPIAPEDNDVTLEDLPVMPVVVTKARERVLSLVDLATTLKYIVADRAQRRRFFPHTLARVLKGVDIVHTVDLKSKATYTAAMLKDRCGYRLVVTVWENIPFLYRQKPRWTSMRRVALEHVDLIHAVTQDAADVLAVEGVTDAPVRVVPYGVDVRRFKPGEDTRRPFFTVLFIGRQVYEKGVFELLNALRLLNMHGVKDVRLLMVGESTAEVRNTANELGISDLVEFTGFVSYADLQGMYSRADAFVLPSIPLRGWKEQYGMVLLEAMASGLPVIASRSGSIPEVVGDVAVLVGPGEYKDIAHAIRSLKDDGSLRERLRRMSRERAEMRFDARVTGARLSEMYRAL